MSVHLLGLATDEQLTIVRRTIARYTPDDQEDLETRIYLGRQELQTPPD